MDDQTNCINPLQPVTRTGDTPSRGQNLRALERFRAVTACAAARGDAEWAPLGAGNAAGGKQRVSRLVGVFKTSGHLGCQLPEHTGIGREA